MKRITQKEILHYRKARNTNWHDVKYWELVSSNKGSAIDQALALRQPFDTIKDTQEKANFFYTERG